MKEHAFVTVAKIGLLVFVSIMLVLTFAAHGDTQEKVIATRAAIDEVRDQVADIRRSIRQGVPISDQPAAAPTAPRGPRRPGYHVLFQDEPPRPRPPDDKIDFDHQFRFQLPVEPKGMNHLTSDRDAYNSVTIGHFVYGPLAERMRSDKNLYKPGLAEHVEVSPDRREFWIWLRRGVFWHRPPLDLTDARYAWMRGRHEVTTEDLVFTLDMLRDSRADTAALGAAFQDIAEYEAVDRYTLRVLWKKPSYYATGILMGDLMPVPKWIYAFDEDGNAIDEASLGQQFAKHWFSKYMCGYGAYVFKSYERGDSLLLERNEDWWGRRPAFKTIYYKLGLRDDEPRYNTYLSRAPDGDREQHTYPVSSTRWRREVVVENPTRDLTDPSRSYIFQYQRMMYAYAGWACRGVHFSDARVRRAMTLAANRPEWMQKILLGHAVNPSGVAFVEAPEYDRSVAPWPYDLDQARALLEEAGWRDEDDNGVREKSIEGRVVEFRFRILETPGSPELDAMRSDWQQSLRRIGVIMEPQVVEWNEFLKRLDDRNFEAYFGAWMLGNEFQPELILHSRLIDVPGSDNRVEWSHDRADRIMDELVTTFELPARYSLLHEFHRIFHEEQPYTVTWSWRNPVAHDAHIGGMIAQNFTPQIDLRDIYWVRDGVAEYEDDRKVPPHQR